MYARAFSRAGAFIGVRDLASGRFVPDAFAPHVVAALSKADIRRARRIMARRLAEAAQRSTFIPVDSECRNRQHVAPMVGADGEPITRKSRLTDSYAPIPDMPNRVKKADPTLYSNERAVKRHTVPTGRMSTVAQTRGIGAITAANVRMGDRARARAMQNRAGKLTIRYAS